MKPKFNTDFEYDQWEEKQEQKKLLDEYFGENNWEEKEDGNK